MKSVRCAICNSTGYKTLFKTRDYDSDGKIWFNIVKCNNCHLVYINPQPDRRFLSKFYVFNYYGNQSFFYRIFAFINNFIIKNKASYILKKKKGNLLDIGCGDGDFLNYMKAKGWNVYGIEPSKSGSNIAKIKLKENIYNAELSQVHFRDKYFDTVTLWHVLEHVSEPDKLLNEIRRIIKTGGMLVIAVPNIDSYQARIGGKKWFHLDVPRHLYHFSPETLKKLLEKNGFRIYKIKHFSFVYNLIGVIQTLLNMIAVKFNFLHHLIKRVDRQKSYMNFSFILNFLLTLIFAIILFVPSVILSFLESLLKHGATITVFAKRIS